MDIIAGLNPQQRVAVEHGSGPALVLAGAGSGKTRVITYRIGYLIQNAAARPQHILAVTFTNKAAKEMRERVQKLMGPNRVSEPLITTFHSLGVRLLRREIQNLGYRRDFSIYDTDDQKRLVKQLLVELKLSEADLTPREVLSRISYAKNHNVGPEAYLLHFRSPDAEDIAEIYQRYNERLRQSNALDFDDLLLKTVALLDRFPESRDYYSDWYRYILVDEYQDTNRPQYDLLRLLTSAHKNLFVVGDEDQSIYKFRGADIQNILRFEKDFPGSRVIKLEQNYRSTQNILGLAGAVVENNTERKGKVLWTENVRGDVATCLRADTARDESVRVAREIRNLLADQPEARIAVLYRANFISRNFEDVLTSEGIRYSVVGSVAFFGRAEVKDMLAYLKLVYNPEDDLALLRIINTPTRGIGNTTIEKLSQAALEQGAPISTILREKAADPQFAGRNLRALARFQEMLDGWMSMRDNISASGLLQIILKETQYREMLEKQETSQEAEDRLANIEELIRAASESEERGETVFEFLDRASLSSELDQFDSNSRVVLMTLHSAKGLEFDVVFLVGLEEGLFPHSLSTTKEDLEEERRLCYVGITRARQKLFLSWTPFRRSFGAEASKPADPSRFLSEMPVQLLEGLDLSPGYSGLRNERSRVREDSDTGYRSRWQDAEAQEGRTYEPASNAPKTIAELRSYLEKQTPKSSEQPPKGPVIKSGMRVRHAMFGDGIVINRERVGDDIKLTITFSRVGKKTLMEKYAKLEAL